MWLSIMTFWRRQSKWVWFVFAVFVMINTAYLGDVPGLMGDEGSEGENVYELQKAGKIVFVGERSYIGPMIDYVRVPGVWLFGYNALALRVVMLLASVILFWMCVNLAEKVGADQGGVVAVVAGLFSPIYILYQRLGWAITLIPFFTILIIVIITSQRRFKWWWAGVVMGLGLSNHIIFAGAAAGIVIGLMVIGLSKINEVKQNWKKLIIGTVVFILGFILAFSSQALVIMKMKEDQGDPALVANMTEERWQALPQLLPMIVSGSSFMAAYTGMELKHNNTLIVTGVVMTLVIIAGALNWQRPISWAWLLGTIGQLVALMFMIDRFTLRYFVPLALSLWAMAGWGAWSLMRQWLKDKRWPGIIALALALILTAGMVWKVGWVYLETSGSNNEFAIGNRTNNARDLVQVSDLLACVQGIGDVYAEDIHIRNRLIYLSHGQVGYEVKGEEYADEADYLIEYRKQGGQCNDAGMPERCRNLKWFCVIEKKE